jgi:hypothetical protein
MSPDPSAEEIRVLVGRYSLTPDQARRVLTEHGAHEDKWGEAARNLIHFF